MKVAYLPSFVRQYKKLSPSLRQEVLQKIKVFEADHTDSQLKTHKLHGNLKDFWSFSINYRYRIIFEITEDEANFLEIGDHDLYK